ncbi:hypothetical protein Abr02nite_33430 [Paractinoplanes brasiliensis]|nr:hypothetical protein Abr02nite_33430 [Actinoplanes brasiliensis]
MTTAAMVDLRIRDLPSTSFHMGALPAASCARHASVKPWKPGVDNRAYLGESAWTAGARGHAREPAPRPYDRGAAGNAGPDVPGSELNARAWLPGAAGAAPPVRGKFHRPRQCDAGIERFQLR